MEPDDSPRKLTRSTTDKYVWGVAGGLGRQFGVDPLLFRIAFGVAVIFGGIGIPAYLALGAFLPPDDGGPAWIENKSKPTTVVVIVVLGCFAVSAMDPPGFLLGPGLIAVAGFTVLGVGLYRWFGGQEGEDPARVIARLTLVGLCLVAMFAVAVGVGFVAAIGGGVAVAAISIVTGLALIAAGLLGGPRWLILPAMVLVLPLAVVSSADLDLRGGVGHVEYRPDRADDLPGEYRLGMGQMELDLRDLTGPANVNVRIGMGEARVRVPADACVRTHANIGVGAIDMPNRVDDGVNVDYHRGTNRATLVINADIGVGHLRVDGQNAKACA